MTPVIGGGVNERSTVADLKISHTPFNQHLVILGFV